MASKDAALVARLETRDPSALALFYDMYGRRIYNLAFRMLGNAQDAEDITQETVLAVASHVRSFRGESQFATWVYAIAKNQCRRLYRQRKRTSFDAFERLLTEAATPELPDDVSETEKQRLVREVKEGCLTGLLRCLSFNQRIAFILHTLLRLPIREVAVITGKSEAATKVLVFRARQSLKTFLCKNCSLYDPGNSCRCENMIDFSLKHGWIERQTGDATDTLRIEREIKQMGRVIALFASLDEAEPSGDLHDRVREMMRDSNWAILSRT